MLHRYQLISSIMLIILLILLLTTTINAQSFNNDLLTRNKSIVKLSIQEIYNSDTSKIIDRKFYSWNDSINTYCYNNYYWFKLKLANRKWDDDRAVELFAYDKNKRELYQITRNELNWTDGYSGTTEDIYTCFNKLFVIKYPSKTYPYVQIIIINSKKHEIVKELILNMSCWIARMYENNNQLHLIVQPYTKELNFSYFPLFWMPRGRPSKWNYNDKFNKWEYILDMHFTIVQKKELLK